MYVCYCCGRPHASLFGSESPGYSHPQVWPLRDHQADDSPSRLRLGGEARTYEISPDSSACRRSHAAVAASAGKNDSIASSDTMTSTGVPNTVVAE